MTLNNVQIPKETLELNTFTNTFSSNSIENYILDNFNTDDLEETRVELESLINELNSSSSCARFLTNIITPNTIGLYFFANENIFTSINSIIPDLFRKCFVRDPDSFSNSPSLICPIFNSNPFEDNTQQPSYNFYLQYIIDSNLLKTFLYFNFSSNFYNLKENKFNLISFKARRDAILKFKSFGTNSQSYTDPTTIFHNIYSEDSLIKTILTFGVKLTQSGFAQFNSTNFPAISLEWFSSFNCLSTSGSTKKFITYSNIENDKNSLLYSDMVYLNRCEKNIKNLAVQFGIDLYKNEALAEDLEYNTIYTIIKITKQVLQDILVEIDALLNDKSYRIPDYTSKDNLLICLSLYKNYIKNELYIQNTDSGIIQDSSQYEGIIDNIENIIINEDQNND